MRVIGPEHDLRPAHISHREDREDAKKWMKFILTAKHAEIAEKSNSYEAIEFAVSPYPDLTFAIFASFAVNTRGLAVSAGASTRPALAGQGRQ
jgi:hypothetical protein